MAVVDVPEPQWRKAAAAHKRAMPIQRLLGNGMEYADVHALYSAVDAGQDWWDAAEEIGRQNRHRGEQAEAAGQWTSAIGWYRRASASFRFGQVPLEDDAPRKSEMYRQLIATFAAAGALMDPPLERIEVDFRGQTLAGWLQLPAQRVDGRVPATVMIFGGFDGWREEYDAGAQALQARGLATCLVDLPGQGEARVLGDAHMPDDPDGVVEAVGAFVTALRDHPLVDKAVGVWGNSLGGYLAARAAARDSRIGAVCVNGGSDRPGEILERYPRFIRKIELLFGVDDPIEAARLLAALALSPDLLTGLRCPLMVLHGQPDQIFLIESARRLFAAAGAHDKTLIEWPDGDHCIYNHSYDKHAAVSDWFTDRLHPAAAGP